MKTYRFLWPEVISDENIELAIKESCKSRKKNKKKMSKLMALRNNPNRIEIVRNWIINYKTIKREPKKIYDGISKKQRYIYVPSIRETIVQHAVVQVLDKYLSKSLYTHTYAAIRGRGQHKAKKVIEKWIKNIPENMKYYLKLDIKQYFPSIPQKNVIRKLSKNIKDTKVLSLIQKTLEASDYGIPLGYYISQWLANYYLTDFDHRLKKIIGKDKYIRWMDDMVIFSATKKNLHKFKIWIDNFLYKLGLSIKKNWKIVKFLSNNSFLDYMGFKFYNGYSTLRKSIYFRLCKKAKKISYKEKPTIFEIRQFLSYLGWIKHSCMYNAYLIYVKPYINIQYMKRRLSRYDKRKEIVYGLCAC